jgi:hypothetical protein
LGLALLVTALFAACTEQHPPVASAADLEPPKPAPQQEQVRQQPLVASTVLVHPPASAAVVDDSSVEEVRLDVIEEPVLDASISESEPTPELAPRTLDLAYKPGAASENPEQGNYVGDQKGLLPNLFDQDKAGRKVSVSGGVTLDHEQQEVRDALTGGELSVKIRTP